MCYQLIEQLVLGIAFRLRGSYENPGLTEQFHGETYFWHGATTAHENGCAVLWHLQIATAAFAYNDGSRRTGVTFATYRDMVDRNEVTGFPVYFHVPELPDCLDALSRSQRDAWWPDMRTMLAAYLDLEANFAPPNLPTIRNASFLVETQRHQDAMEEFVRAGYAKKEGNTYGWTEKFAPALKSIYLWD